jgi:hypothetical protein
MAIREFGIAQPLSVLASLRILRAGFHAVFEIWQSMAAIRPY